MDRIDPVSLLGCLEIVDDGVRILVVVDSSVVEVSEQALQCPHLALLLALLRCEDQQSVSGEACHTSHIQTLGGEPIFRCKRQDAGGTLDVRWLVQLPVLITQEALAHSTEVLKPIYPVIPNESCDNSSDLVLRAP